MKRVILLLTLLVSLQGYGQVIEGVKHIEIVSEISDTMALINKYDVDKINRTYFEKNRLDSLNRINEDIIKLYEKKYLSLANITDIKDDIIKDKDLLISETKSSLEAKYEAQKEETKKMQNKKIIWQSISIAEIAIFLLIIL